MIEFVSYTGEYPCLCMGVLTLKIDGKEYKFGHEVFSDWNKDGNYDRFWSSGGGVYFSDDYSDVSVECYPWVIDKDDLPDWLKDRAEEIESVFNENVDYGCCGGCI